MKIDERHLVQLAAVVEAGGVSEAAARLGMSQPGVSRTIAMLEKRLGAALFLRGKRPLQPTPLGRQLAIHGRAIQAAAKRASDTVQGFQTGRSGLVRIAGVPFFMDAMISGMVASFQIAEPEIRVDQTYGYLQELEAALAADQIDLAIAPMGIVETNAAFAFEEILPARNIVACRTAHPVLRNRPMRTSDLLAYPWIAPLPGSPLLADLHSILSAIGMSEVNVRYSGGSLMSVMNYMVETNAFAVLPHSVVFAFRKRGQITAAPIEIPQPRRVLGILRRKGAKDAPAVEKFSRHIAASFAELRHLIRRHEEAVVWGR